MFSRLRYFFEDVGYWLSDRLRLRRRRGQSEREAPPSAREAPASPPDAAPPTTEAGKGPSRLRRPRLPRVRRPQLRRPRKPQLGRPRRPQLRRPGRRTVLAAAAVLVAVAAVALYLTDRPALTDSEPAPAPQVVIEEEAAEEAAELGFPAFATKNTTRVAGDGPVADAAGVALATTPATGGVEGPPAVALVADEDWPAGIAAASLVAEPVGVSVLISGRDDVPDLALSALTALAPRGSPETGDAQLFRIGDVAAPEGLRTRSVEGANPAELAAATARLRERLTGEEPEHLLLVSSDRPEFAMPGAAWAARSGDPVLFVQRDSVPGPTAQTLRRHPDVPVYVLGPTSVISDDVMDTIAEETESRPRRVGEDDPVTNAIAFARYSDGEFGWNVTDPGHGLVIANASRPASAGAAAALSASGKWGPLLLTDSAEELPTPLQGYLLDIKPGYIEDPTRAVYNHAWVIGDAETVSVGVQAQIDALLEVAQVGAGRGRDTLAPGQPEDEADDRDRQDDERESD